MNEIIPKRGEIDVRIPNIETYVELKLEHTVRKTAISLLFTILTSLENR